MVNSCRAILNKAVIKLTAKCTVCVHEEVNTINEKLITGSPVRTLAKEYDLGIMALQRHRANHLPKHLIKAKEAQEVDAADQLLDKVQGLYNTALEIMKEAREDGKFQPAVSALKEARSSLELIAKMIGELKTGHTVNITYNQEFIEVRQQIHQALLPYPEARQAVIEALAGEVIDVEHEEVNQT